MHSSKECVPYLRQKEHSHILNITPPLNFASKWFTANLAYTLAKYGSSLLVIGLAEELKEFNISVNGLWPRTYISTAAVDMLVGVDKSKKFSRKPDIMADAAYYILSQTNQTGNLFVDENVVKLAGVTDIAQYACTRENADKLMLDAYVD